MNLALAIAVAFLAVSTAAFGWWAHGGFLSQDVGGPPRLPANHLEEKENTMGIDDLVNKGKQLFETNKEKIDEVLSGDQAEKVSDEVLDAGANSINNLVPDEHQSKVGEVRTEIDKRIGNE